jgi:hypothetical protein
MVRRPLPLESINERPDWTKRTMRTCKLLTEGTGTTWMFESKDAIKDPLFQDPSRGEAIWWRDIAAKCRSGR